MAMGRTLAEKTRDASGAIANLDLLGEFIDIVKDKKIIGHGQLKSKYATGYYIGDMQIELNRVLEVTPEYIRIN